jgi:hypothetical protein
MRTKTAKKPQLPKAEGTPVVVLTSDTLINLIDRLNKLEQQYGELKSEVQANFDYVVDCIPTVIESGDVMQAKVFEINSD